VHGDRTRCQAAVRASNSTRHTFQGQEHAATTLEWVILTACLIWVLSVGGVYFKRSLQGYWKEPVDRVGGLFSPAMSNFTMRSHHFERTNNVRFTNGYSRSTLLNTMVTNHDPWLDDFSGRRLVDEGLYQ